MARDEPSVRAGVTPELLLQAYVQGIFPMSDGAGEEDIFWVDPRLRGILPLDGFHLSRSLRRRIRATPFEITFDQDFAGVLGGCADREETWINPVIADLYLRLHERGVAHSIEVHEEGALVGGVYGVTLGGAFFGESMFSVRRDASKIALVYLIDRLRENGFTLFDTQFVTDHLVTLGAIEIPRDEYRTRLSSALLRRVRFDASAPIPSPDHLLQRMTQTS
ncbi:leucyl/phenylalanyl-tRNA--protein transferase [Palleronia sp. LCG004]|uniref:leucyl/phenylalanyl-tRNA--protein transferase n=1 Tax=Palleronia sp. LCG004 TaxID=3079304 RepID=UPI0029428BD8|nr:leucyl/phenylalanyl-tRNA--protein transferase [Palleronia sp. LCG004]WOI55279.1 leucyl/phenylalanyl-tRNA--protein transferase [Palleronia sp. LCG004]